MHHWDPRNGGKTSVLWDKIVKQPKGWFSPVFSLLMP